MHEMIVAWMRSQHTTLFGQFFDTVQNVEQAAQWFERQMESFIQYAEHNYPPPAEPPSLADVAAAGVKSLVTRTRFPRPAYWDVT